MHDICENPERFDSWAGMALARMSRLEQKLNSVSTNIHEYSRLYYSYHHKIKYGPLKISF